VACEDDVAGELEIWRERTGEDVWEVSGEGVDLFRKEGWPFIGRRGSTGGVQWRTGHRACRLWEGQGVALARRGHVRRCCGDIGNAMAQQGDEGEREEQWPEVGGPGVFSSVLPCLTARVGAGEAGDRQRGERGCPRVRLGG
jgi:hypothetical protein